MVDSAYVSLDLLIRSKDEYGIDIVGPARIAPGWREKIKEAYSVDMFNIDWDNEEITCPEGKKASSWRNKDDYITAVFSVKDCRNCLNKKFCIRGKTYKRKVCFPAKEQYNARVALRKRLRSEEGKILYRKRAGIEGTISQGVRLCGMRKSRYIGLKKNHLQNISSASAMNLYRLADYFDGIPLAKTRKASFLKLKNFAA